MHERSGNLGVVKPWNRRDGSLCASNVSVRRHIIMAIKGRIANCADLNILVSAMHHRRRRLEERRRVRAWKRQLTYGIIRLPLSPWRCASCIVYISDGNTRFYLKTYIIYNFTVIIRVIDVPRRKAGPRGSCVLNELLICGPSFFFFFFKRFCTPNVYHDDLNTLWSSGEQRQFFLILNWKCVQ